jgi:MFS transporter, ACS family, hexuronate transporter
MSSPQSSIGKYRWVICALLFFATTINYIDRQILSLVKPILDKELGWTNAQFGLVNTFFQAAYGLSLPIFGWVIDKYGAKIGYAVSIAAWSVAACGHSLVGSFQGFIAARVALGLGEGGNFPSAIKAVALWFPKKERAYATALFNSGANVGAIAAPAIVPFVALTLGWQAAFVGAGLLGFIWLFFWFPFFDVPGKIKGIKQTELDYIHSDVDEQAETKTKVPWSNLLSHKEAWSFIVAKFLTDPVWWFFLIWLPDYFKKTRHLDIKNSWVHLVAIYAVITVLSIVGGWVTGFLTKRGWTVTRARKTGMFVFAAAVLPILAVTTVGDWTAVLIIGLAGAAHQAWSANLFTTVADMFPKKAVGSLVGIGGLAGSVGGMLFPIICGVVIDRYVAAGNPTAGYAILFGFCGSAYLIAFAIHHLLAPKFEQVTITGIEPDEGGGAVIGH